LVADIRSALSDFDSGKGTSSSTTTFGWCGVSEIVPMWPGRCTMDSPPSAQPPSRHLENVNLVDRGRTDGTTMTILRAPLDNLVARKRLSAGKHSGRPVGASSQSVITGLLCAGLSSRRYSVAPLMQSLCVFPKQRALL